MQHLLLADLLHLPPHAGASGEKHHHCVLEIPRARPVPQNQQQQRHPAGVRHFHRRFLVAGKQGKQGQRLVHYIRRAVLDGREAGIHGTSFYRPDLVLVQQAEAENGRCGVLLRRRVSGLEQINEGRDGAEATVGFLKSIRASAVKIYDANPAILRALCGSGIVVSVMVPNGLLPAIGTNQSAADDWVAANIVPFHNSVRLRFLLVGNEILSDYASNSTFWPYLVPAMKRLHRSLRFFSMRGIKVSTTHAMDVLQTSFPPSAGRFRSDIAGSIIRPMLDFFRRTSSYFFVDAYPYFSWSRNPTSISIDYALFQGTSNSYYHDLGSGFTYTNLLDQMLDAVAAAIAAEGFGEVRVGLAETGWPNEGDLDQIGANVHNAAIYNRNLARRVAENRGLRTPAMPAAAIPVFVFALYNENLKPGPGTERHWGLLYPNGTAVYEVDLKGRRPASSYPPLPPATNNKPYKGKLWCVLATGSKVNATVVAAAVTYACGQGNGTCAAIQPGGKCYRPNTVTAHASYAFNSYWQQFRSIGGSCYFSGLAVETTKDPSHGSCVFPSKEN